MCRILKIGLLSLLAIILLATPVFAYLYRSPLTVVESSGNAYTMLPWMVRANNQFMADNGFMESDALDTRVQTLGGLNKPHMATPIRTISSTAIPANSQTNLYFVTGESDLSGLDIIIGHSGYVTIPDDASIELANNFEVEQKGWIDTDSGDSKNLIYKSLAFRTYISGTEEVTAEISCIPFPKLNNPVALPASTGRDVAFTDDGTYLAVAHSTSPYVTIYKRSGDTFTKLANPAALPANTGYGAAFTGDGVYLAVAHGTSPYVTIYKRSGDVFTKLANPANLPAGTGQGCAFTSDGTYLAVAHATSPYVTIYKRSGDTFTKLADPAALPVNTGYGVAFADDGIYLAVGHSGSPYVTIYKRSGDTFTKLANPAALPANTGYGAAFTGDGVYLAVAHVNSPYVTIYKRSGDTFTKLANPAVLPAGTGQSCAFTSDRVYLAVAHSTSPYVTIYGREGDIFTKITNPAVLPASTGGGVAFTDDEAYLAVAHANSPYVTIYKICVKVTAAGISSGEYTVRTLATGGGTNLLQMWVGDGDAAATLRDSVALAGASVPDNANDYTIMENDVIPYLEYMTIDVSSVEKLKYLPIGMVTDTQQDGTADAGGSTVKLIDAELTQADDYWNLARLIITDTTDDLAPKGETVVVTDFLAATDELQFAALTAGIDAGDTYDVSFGTLNDETGTNDGTITWGHNPTGVTVSLGSMASAGQPAIGGTIEDTPSSVLPEAEVSDWFGDGTVGGAILTNPIRPFITMVSDNTDLTEILVWRWMGLVLLLFIAVASARLLRGHLGITIIIVSAVMAGLVSVDHNIFPLWLLVLAVGMFIGGVVAERSPSL